jgi:hypothetical protein
MKASIQFDGRFDDSCDRIEADLGGGFLAVATLEHESETTPGDFDCYSAAELRAYDDGDWYYGTVTLTLMFRGDHVGIFPLTPRRIAGVLGCIGGVEIHPDDAGGFDAVNESAVELLEESDWKKVARKAAKQAGKAARSMAVAAKTLAR